MKAKKNKGGRPSWLPDGATIQMVETLAGQGLTSEQIADCLGIGKTTLYDKAKNYEEFSNAIKKGKGKAAGFVTGKLFEQIRKDNLTATIFYLKTQLGWKETEARELTGKDGSALQLETHKKETSDLIDERISKMTEKAKEKE